MAEEKLIGKVSHFFGKPSVGIIKLSDAMKIGDKVHIKGHTTDLTQQVTSMQIEHDVISEGKAGDEVGIKVEQKVHENDEVFKVIE
jgi:putative protease